jgi:hypothetical protein
MIVFRHADPRVPFLWEGDDQPEARWHKDDGPAHYFSDTPDGAWADLLRHEDIRDPEDVATVRRAIWAAEIPDDEKAAEPALPKKTLIGGTATFAACQQEAARLRANAATRIDAPSAALVAGGARGHRVSGGLRPAKPRHGRTIVLFGSRPDLVGWRAVHAGQPHPELLGRVRRA